MISKKIRDRENIANLASKMVNPDRMSDKEALQRKHENQEFFIYKRTMDPAYRRVVVKNMAADNNVSKFLKNPKSEKDIYYEKCVE